MRDPDRFVYTRGPHEGEYSGGEHACVPECYEDTSHLMEDGHWVDPRPRYRVLVAPWYDHGPTERPYHPDGAGHDRDCAAGYELEVAQRYPDQPPPHGQWQPLGTTRTAGRGALDAREARDVVVNYVRAVYAAARAPRPSSVAPELIELYVRVES